MLVVRFGHGTFAILSRLEYFNDLTTCEQGTTCDGPHSASYSRNLQPPSKLRVFRLSDYFRFAVNCVRTLAHEGEPGESLSNFRLAK